MRDSILNVKSSGLGGVVHEVKRGARKVDKFNASVSRYIEKKKKEKYKSKEIMRKGNIKARVNQYKEVGKETKNRQKALSTIHSGKGYTIKKSPTAKPQPVEKHGYKRNEWGDIVYY